MVATPRSHKSDSMPNEVGTLTLTLTWRRLLALMLARHWLIWGGCILFGGIAFAISRFVLPEMYTASAEVLLDFRESDPVQGQIQTPSLISPGYVATQADIIASDRVTRKVVHKLGLDTNPASIQQWHEAGEKGTIDQYYMDALRKGLEVRPSRLSNVLSVKFSSPSPTYAATVANAWAKSYVETDVELKADPARDFKAWFDLRTQQARENLAQSQTRLSEFLRKKGVVIPTDEHIDVETSRLSELNLQLTAVQAQLAEAESRRDQAAGQMGDSPDVLQNPLVQTLRGEVARAEAKQKELGRELGQNHPSLLSGQAQLESLKEKLDSEIHRVAASLRGSNSVIAQKEQQIRAALDAQKQRVLQLRAAHDEAAVLRNDVESAQRAYDMVLQHLSTTNLVSLVQQTNVTVLSEALPPVKKSSPRTLLNTTLGLLLGLLAGTGLAILIELRRPRLRDADEILTLLGVPVLASILHVRRSKADKALAIRKAAVPGAA